MSLIATRHEATAMQTLAQHDSRAVTIVASPPASDTASSTASSTLVLLASPPPPALPPVPQHHLPLIPPLTLINLLHPIVPPLPATDLSSARKSVRFQPAHQLIEVHEYEPDEEDDADAIETERSILNAALLGAFGDAATANPARDAATAAEAINALAVAEGVSRLDALELLVYAAARAASSPSERHPLLRCLRRRTKSPPSGRDAPIAPRRSILKIPLPGPDTTPTRPSPRPPPPPAPSRLVMLPTELLLEIAAHLADDPVSALCLKLTARRFVPLSPPAARGSWDHCARTQLYARLGWGGARAPARASVLSRLCARLPLFLRPKRMQQQERHWCGLCGMDVPAREFKSRKEFELLKGVERVARDGEQGRAAVRLCRRHESAERRVMWVIGARADRWVSRRCPVCLRCGVGLLWGVCRCEDRERSAVGGGGCEGCGVVWVRCYVRYVREDGDCEEWRFVRDKGGRLWVEERRDKDRQERRATKAVQERQVMPVHWTR